MKRGWVVLLAVLACAGCRAPEPRDGLVFDTVSLEPRNGDLARFDVARAHYLAGDLERAIKLCNEILEDGSHDAGVYDLRGLAKAAQGKHKKAIEDFGIAIANDPPRADIRFHRGNSRFVLKDWKAAESDYTEALRLEEIAAAHNNRGNARGAQGEWAMAVVDYNAAIELDPNLGAAYRNRARARARLGDEEGAHEDTERSQELEPRVKPRG